NGVVRLWDPATGKVVRELATPHLTTYTVAYSPDGRTLATGGMTGGICLWDPATGRLLRHCRDVTGWVARVCFSPDGRTLAGGAGLSSYLPAGQDGRPGRASGEGASPPGHAARRGKGRPLDSRPGRRQLCRARPGRRGTGQTRRRGRAGSAAGTARSAVAGND